MIPISVFDGNGNLIEVFDLQNQINIIDIPDDLNNPCVVSSPSRPVREYLYRDTIRLLSFRAHTLAFQRCCKNNILDNLDNVNSAGNSSFYGNTFVINIPAPVGSNSCGGANSTPIFNLPPPIVICSGFDINLDMSAVDPDGDSLVYSLCAPSDFNQSQLKVNPITGRTIPNPDTALAPPYIPLQYAVSRSGANPIPSSPQIVIDPQTGLMTGIPTNVGDYVLGFCVEEYRNGVLINTFVRDIQISTANCSPVIVSLLQDQQQFCKGHTVGFINQSTANVNRPNYKWDFGVSGIDSDTSRDFNPTYTFPDTGRYDITLIVNPDFPQCSDTSIVSFQVNDSLAPIVIIDGNSCSNENEFEFIAGGVYEDYASITWTFGPQASISTSTNDTVSGVSYPAQTASFPVKLIVEQDQCSERVDDFVFIVNNPTIDFTVNEPEGCKPHAVRFTSSPIISGNGAANYEWDFGDGSAVTIQNSLQNPTHVYAVDGSYTVKLTLRSIGDCQDTVIAEKPAFVRVGSQFSNNSVSFTYKDSAGCYPYPVQFTNNSMFNGVASFIWNFGDGTTSTDVDPLHVYDSNGYFNVSLEMNTTSGCIEAINSTIDSAIHISLDLSTNEVGFIVDQTTGCAPVEIQFTDTSIFEGSAQFKWFFGDGDSSNLQNPVHVYENDGFFDVQLILTTTEKCVDTIETTKPSLIETDLRFSDNVVDFDFFPKEGCPPLTVQFSDSSFAGGNIEYFWDFNDGGLSNDQNPTNTYLDTGEYTVGLLIITSGRCKDTLNKLSGESIRVLPEPSAQINASDSALTLKEALFNFNNAGSEFVASSKYLINGNEVGQSEVLDYQFTDTGHFQVSYIATNSFGCSDTSSAEVFVFDEFQFIIPNVFTPNGDEVNDQFKMLSCGVYDYQIRIFNRYGDELFHSNSLNINWEGRVAGKLANSGTFFYTIRIKDFKGKFLDYNGSVLLLRD
ncbi:MAG: PKD domain-containing protein [Flavobacteriales bacterium]|nr:PKD domain-containing protein [Flavobacteriales bacterium]